MTQNAWKRPLTIHGYVGGKADSAEGHIHGRLRYSKTLVNFATSSGRGFECR